MSVEAFYTKASGIINYTLVGLFYDLFSRNKYFPGITDPEYYVYFTMRHSRDMCQPYCD